MKYYNFSLTYRSSTQNISYSFSRYINILKLVSTTLEGSCSQLWALSLQILLSYQMFQHSHSWISRPLTTSSKISESSTALWHLPPNSASPHCSHHCSRCSSACRKKYVLYPTGCKPIQLCIDSLQRKEDMTSRRSDNLYVLITFQGQESWMQVTRIVLWTKSRRAQGVFY